MNICFNLFQLGIFVSIFSCYTPPCISGCSAAIDAHRSSTLRFSPSFSSSSAVKMRAWRVGSWARMAAIGNCINVLDGDSVKTRRAIYLYIYISLSPASSIHVPVYIYIYIHILYIQTRLPEVVCGSYKCCFTQHNANSRSRLFSSPNGEVPRLMRFKSAPMSMISPRWLVTNGHKWSCFRSGPL